MEGPSRVTLGACVGIDATALCCTSHSQTTMEGLHDLLSQPLFDALCDRFSASFYSKYLEQVFACSRVGKAGAMQLQLDAVMLQAVLLKLPFVGRGTESKKLLRNSIGSSAFSRLLRSAVAKTQRILQLVGMDAADAIKHFKTCWEDGRVEDMMKILMLKGGCAALAVLLLVW